MVRVPAGAYVPLFRQPSKLAERARGPRRRQVAAFEMDVHPVTNAEFLAFVDRHPQWRRSQAKKLFVDEVYLAHWKGDLELGDMAPPASPVVNVSWFAARAYLRAQGKQLPTVDQWEYVAAASETGRDSSRRAAFPGVQDLPGRVWEWTLDFSSALVTGESRGDSALERTLYCGSGAVGAADFENYPAFMRYALRGSLEARYSVGSLGFRGVRSQGGVRE
jgi:formylglycine-generating enzyme required for sulfatase activity